VQRDELVGPVKVVKTEKTIQSAESKGMENRFGGEGNAKSTVYNRAGNKTEEIIFGEDGEVTQKKVSNYDGAGKLDRVLTYDSRGAVLGKYVYTYGPVKNEIVESYGFVARILILCFERLVNQ